MDGEEDIVQRKYSKKELRAYAYCAMGSELQIILDNGKIVPDDMMGDPEGQAYVRNIVEHWKDRFFKTGGMWE